MTRHAPSTNLALVALAAALGTSSAFQVSPPIASSAAARFAAAVPSARTLPFVRAASSGSRLYAATEDDAAALGPTDAAVAEADAAMSAMSADEKVEKVGNLIADDEWMGLSMEISELVRTAIVEDVKDKTSDFTGKDDYRVGDISKEMDSRIKEEVAKFREKDEYELGDLSIALDEMSKEFTKELTGKDEYEVGDLSKEIDSRVKSAAADFCGTEEYQVGDLSKEIDSRVKSRVSEFTGEEEYSFGDISRAVEDRRQQWVKDVLGDEAAANYQFGDLTKNAISGFTGKDDYEFGDVTKKLMGNIFGKRKRGGGSS